MKNKTIVTMAVAAFALLSACSEKIEDGRYQMAGFSMTPKGAEENIDLSRIPVFEFYDKNKVNISPDFGFGFFKDSVYTYRLKDGKLYLKGPNCDFEFFCEKSASGAIDIYLDGEYMRQITIIKR